MWDTIVLYDKEINVDITVLVVYDLSHVTSTSCFVIGMVFPIQELLNCIEINKINWVDVCVPMDIQPFIDRGIRVTLGNIESYRSNRIYLSSMNISIGVEVLFKRYDVKVENTILLSDLKEFICTGNKFHDVFKPLTSYSKSIYEYYLNYYRRIVYKYCGTIKNKLDVFQELSEKYEEQLLLKNQCLIREKLRCYENEEVLFYFLTIYPPNLEPIVFLMESNIIL
jgi:hypothetical protein